MKFAVIEYSSKTGKIWKHTPEKPNYLSNPQTEMDPTSFGCYVSAIKGEHIPITSLVKPNFWKKIVKRTTGSWPSYSLAYLKQFDAVMIVHQISDGHEVTKLTKRIKKAYPHVKILGVPTQPYGILKDHWEQNTKWLKDFRDFMNTCDVFLTIVESTKDDWQKMTTTKVEYLPQPYPVEYTKQFWKPQADKKKIIYIAGRPVRNNIPKGLQAAQEIQHHYPDYEIHITQLKDDESFDSSVLANLNYTTLPFMPWHDLLPYLSRVALVINTDYTQTRGRMQVDCAAVGTPSIGADSDAQVDLFPKLPASPDQSISSLVKQAKQLLGNPSHYDTVNNIAKQRLDEYTYPKSAARIKDLVSSL